MRTKDKWPTLVPIPDSIGRHTLTRNGVAPNCALGHATHLISGRVHYASECYRRSGKPLVAWVANYCLAAKAAKVVGDRPINGAFARKVVLFNDMTTDDATRLLVYLTAWYLCGYTVGMPSPVRRLARKVERADPR